MGFSSCVASAWGTPLVRLREKLSPRPQLPSVGLQQRVFSPTFMRAAAAAADSTAAMIFGASSVCARGRPKVAVVACSSGSTLSLATPFGRELVAPSLPLFRTHSLRVGCRHPRSLQPFLTPCELRLLYRDCIRAGQYWGSTRRREFASLARVQGLLLWCSALSALSLSLSLSLHTLLLLRPSFFLRERVKSPREWQLYAREARVVHATVYTDCCLSLSLSLHDQPDCRLSYLYLSLTHSLPLSFALAQLEAWVRGSGSSFAVSVLLINNTTRSARRAASLRSTILAACYIVEQQRQQRVRVCTLGCTQVE